MKKTMYMAYVQKMHMVPQGDRYEIFASGDDYDDWEVFEDHDSAVSWAKATFERMHAAGEDYKVTDAKRGLDYVEYHDYCVVPYTDFGNDCEVEYDFDHDELICTLPDDVRKAIDDATRSYHRYLDFESDYYYGATYLLNKESENEED